MILFSIWGRRYIHTSASLRKKTKIKMTGRTPSSQQWLIRQMKDPYVKQAQVDNYRARSAFKLLEIDARYQLLRPGHVVVDCGAAPGSWSQVAVERVNALGKDPTMPSGKVISVDLQHIEPIEGAILLPNADFTLSSTQSSILTLLNGQLVNTVVSDMAPNSTGVRSMDHDVIMELCRSALRFARKVLREDGNFLCKLWQGQDTGRLKEELTKGFRGVKVVKPDASRKESAEVFLLGRGFKRYLFHSVGAKPSSIGT
ncbi:rRNA methyltransferase 2, mitochondrial-like [Asterias rubens]|uniref:rRNA methyltransferase 2, mitochondrial-like n=1 Tax=Asterias rubens TaxID=7604 RepID=UPI001455B352|nr:rRNA methyltransferase 2, mitochondrial-like [Asterias rubens]